jgi:hypothetical protein
VRTAMLQRQSINGVTQYHFTPPATGQWEICSLQRSLSPLPEAHNYLAMVNPRGQVVYEAQGGFSNTFTMFGAQPGNYLTLYNGGYTASNAFMTNQPITSVTPVAVGTNGNGTALANLWAQAASTVDNDLVTTGMLYNGSLLSGQ